MLWKKIMRLAFSKFLGVVSKISKGKFSLRNWKKKLGLQLLQVFRNTGGSWSHGAINENIRTMYRVKKELKILVLENASIQGALKWEKPTKKNKKKSSKEEKQEKVITEANEKKVFKRWSIFSNVKCHETVMW